MIYTFIRDIPHNQDNIALVKTIITLAHNLGKRVVAEGVETREQLEFLIQEKCDEMQGFYFSKPLPADQIKKMIKEKKHLIVDTEQISSIE